MVDTVIVALPREDDRVHKVASGTPHLTLMYLGEEFDENNLESVVRYIQHIAETSLHRFGLSVDRRGTLGDKDADVLFFEDGWDTREIKDVIGYLMADENLAVAYNHQKRKFPKWIPHLTLGYPDKPAKELKDDDTRLWYVEFDRIAIWTGDSEGPEFPLKKYSYSDGEMAMSDSIELGASFSDYFMNEVVLEHYGVKGMRWGKTTKSDDSGSQAASPPKVKESRKDYKERVKKEQDEFYQKKINSIVEKSMKSGEDVLIETRYAGDTYKTITTGKEFVKELSRGRAFDAKTTEIFANKTKEGPYELTGNRTQYVKSKRGEVAHSELDELDEIFHSDAEWYEPFKMGVEDELMHYGVKGMRWGYRKAERVPTGVALKETPGRKVVAKGGKFEKPSEDAKRTAVQRQKVKGSSTDALSNAELKQLVERMQLEANYDRLAKQQLGNSAIKKLFTNKQHREQTVENITNLTMPVRKAAANSTIGLAAQVGNDIKKMKL